MAVELAAGYVSLVPSGRGFGRSLIREAQVSGGLAGDAASSHFGSRFVSGMGRIARRAGIAFTAGLGAAAFFGVRVAADFEQTRIAFEGILGDVDKAAALLGDLRDFAAKTPFEFTGLVDSAKQLLAVGFTSEDIIPTMTTLGDVAATLGVGETEIAGVVRALGQMKGKGKASAEELQQISEQIPGFSAIGAIAEDMGITTAEAFDKLEQGAIPADDAIESILTGMENFPGASGAMERQSKTLNGVISTLKDTVAGMAIDFITPYLPALSRGVESFSGWLQDIAVPALQGLADMLEDKVIPVVSGFVEDGLAAVSEWWDRNGDTIKDGLAAVFSTIGDAATTAGRFIRDELMPPLETFLSWVVEDGPGMQIGITGLAVAMGLWAVNAALAAAATLLTFAPLIVGAILVGLLAWATGELVDKFDLLRRGSTVFQWITDHVIVPFVGQVQSAIRAVEKLIDLITSIPDVPGGDSGLLGTILSGTPLGPLFGGLRGFDDGGVMGGPLGVHSLAWVAGGETILPTHKTPLPSLLGSSGDTNIYVTQLPDEDAGEAVVRGMRKRRLASVPA